MSVLATFVFMTDDRKEVMLKKISYIYYPV